MVISNSYLAKYSDTKPYFNEKYLQSAQFLIGPPP